MIYPTIYKVKTPYGDFEVVIELAKYTNGTVALILKGAEMHDPFAVLSKNLDDYLEDNEIYLDTNNCPWATDFIEEYKLGENLNEDEVSGYCRYPKYRLDIHKITALPKEE